MNKNKILIIVSFLGLGLSGFAQEVSDSVKTAFLKETTGSISRVYNQDFNKRSAKNIGNSLYGYGLGLISLQNSGTYAVQNPTLYVRGLQSLSTNTPLILVDGIERDINNITPEEVATVTILKDATAVALYGYKGINGVISIETKRGKYNAYKVDFKVDYGFNKMIRVPKFVDGLTYAKAMNEARTNDGLTERYSANELAAFENGNYPYLYPNVDWVGETFRNTGITNLYNLSFTGGGSKVRYYALGSLTSNQGFIKHPNENQKYSTQDMYSKANLRTNLDIDLTDKTKLKLNLLGELSETRRPSTGSIWSNIYALPSGALPVKAENGLWGGNATWSGTVNPVALTEGAAYSKYHQRSLFADATLTQDLSGLLSGLSASGMLAYDNDATYYEDHTKTFPYGSQSVATWNDDGTPATFTSFSGGSDGPMGTSTQISAYTRVFNGSLSLDYSQTFNGKHKVLGQLKFQHEYRNVRGVDQTDYFENASFYGHYGYKDTYFADLTMAYSGSNRLAPGHKWGLSPSLGLAWLMSNESFLKNATWINFMKLRGSIGIIQTDNIPGSDYWEQTYGGSSYYPFDTNYSVGTSSWTLGRLASLNSSREKAHKYNFGFDSRFFGALSLTADAFYERRSDIWVSSSGKYSEVLGFTAPYENGGIVDSWGIELGPQFDKEFANGFKLSFGANFTFTKNKIINELEQPQMFPNLVVTGRPYSQVRGMKAIGFFKDQADIDNSPKQLFGDVAPGDIKYEDVNHDGHIDDNDVTEIGHSSTCPEIYYSFHLGSEYKGFGIDAQFQGAGNYSAVLNTSGFYWPLYNNRNLSNYYYDNRWTPDNTSAKFPRLTSTGSSNNFRTSSLWLENRSFLKLRSVEISYSFSQDLLKKTKFISGLKLYVRGTDLLCFDHIKQADPESYGAIDPLTKSVFVGANVRF